MSLGGPNLGGGNWYGSNGPYGAYPVAGGCGCSSFFIIAAGVLLIFGGLLRSCNM